MYPHHRAAGVRAGYPRPTPRPPEPADPTPDLLSVLVVEDEEDAGESLAVLLQMSGYEVWLVRTGAEALRAAAQVPPDVVLLDLGLPDSDGCEVARRLRDGAVGRRPLLVAVTGYGRDEDRHRAEAAGIDLYLVKPADPRALLAVLGRFAPLVGKS
jgi:DNA-binding response OmpR family regulator